MASFGGSFELLRNPNEVIGVEKHSEDDDTILTFRNKEVLVYNVSFVPVPVVLFDNTLRDLLKYIKSFLTGGAISGNITEQYIRAPPLKTASARWVSHIKYHNYNKLYNCTIYM